MFTYENYQKKECTHEEFYSQFVNSKLMDLVVRKIGADAILNSASKHFNDIPLEKWQILNPLIRYCVYTEDIRSTHISWSVSDSVCVAKMAALLYKQSCQNNTNTVK